MTFAAATNANSSANESVRVRESASVRRANVLAGDKTVLPVVMVQEDLLERRLPARELDDRMARERLDQRADAAGHLEAERVRSGGLGLNAGERRQLGCRPREGHLDRLRAQVAQLGERPFVHEPAAAEDADTVAQRLDLAEDVRREEDRLPALLRLEHGLTKGDLHQRVESGGRLVEQEQVGARRERGHELHLLAGPLRQRADALGRVELEAPDENVAVRGVRRPVQAREVRQCLRAGQRGPEERLPRDVRDATVRGDGVAPGVDVEQERAPAGGAVQAEQQPDRRRLPRAVRPEIAVHLARRDGEVEPVERDRVAVLLRQTLRADREPVHALTLTLAAAMAGSRRQLPELGRRGEGWVAVQGVLIAAILLSALVGRGWSATLAPVAYAVGGLLLTLGTTLLVAGGLRLGRSLTPLPPPRAGQRLTTAGIYGLARHPMYGGGILFSLGWSIVFG